MSATRYAASSIIAESTSMASTSRAALLFYVVGGLLLLAFAIDLVQDDGIDWILLGGQPRRLWLASFTRRSSAVVEKSARHGKAMHAEQGLVRVHCRFAILNTSHFGWSLACPRPVMAGPLCGVMRRLGT